MDKQTYAVLKKKIDNVTENIDEVATQATEAWLEENVDPETGYVLDRTLAMQNAAAPADLVGDLKSAIEKNEKIKGYRPFTLEKGGIGSDGKNTTGATNRARTGYLLLGKNIKYVVRSTQDYEYKIFLYSTNAQTGFISELTAGVWTTGDFNISEEYSQKQIRILLRYSPDPSSAISDLKPFYDGVQIQMLFKSGNPLNGKTFSLLGDSISAFAGTIPSGYGEYYTGSNAGVHASSEMWWYVLSKLLALQPLVINAETGSGITQLEDSSHSTKIPMSSNERCGGLSKDGVDPDIILIAGGLNDYTYALSAQSEPLSWDGKTAPTEGASFTETYACMIKKLQTNYPNAIIVALSTWFTMRGTDNGYTLTHSVGNNVYTQKDYDNAIKFVAEQMHIPYLDVSNIGFSRNNFYNKFAEDSSTVPTHPNRFGHMAMGSWIAENLPNVIDSYVLGLLSRLT